MRLRLLFLATLLALSLNGFAYAEVIVCAPGHEHQRLLPDRLHAKVFDTSVNVGVSRAKKLLQQSLNQANPKAQLAVDGKIGAKSRSALCGLDEDILLQIYSARQADFYRAIVARNPSQAKYINGWLRRARWVPK